MPFGLYLSEQMMRTIKLINKQFLFFLFLLFNASSAYAVHIDQNPVGCLDNFRLHGYNIDLSGWAGAGPDDTVREIEVYIGSSFAFRNKAEEFKRPDVPIVTGRPEWINSGWHTNGIIPQTIPQGLYSLRVKAIFHSGKEAVLSPSSPAVDHIQLGRTIHWHKIIKNVKYSSMLLIGCLFCAFILFRPNFVSSIVLRYSGYKIQGFQSAFLAFFFLFTLLVCMGVTGSSIEVGLRHSSDIIDMDSQTIAGVSRPIRSDEYLVLAPMAISQYNQQPRFPVVNKLLGSDGQNMLIVGMTGVPVWHISALAKPATWGFFVLDLRRALSWYWWFPAFGCLFSVWGVLEVLLPGRWQINLGISSLFVTSAYIAAWSLWPANAVMFPALAFFLFFHLFKIEKWQFQMLLGIVIGLSLAGFFFILYPPQQVSLGYLFLLLTAGVIIRDKIWTKFNLSRSMACILAIIISGAICWAWFRDAENAIHLIQHTVYPGQRNAITGGGWQVWEFFKGFINFHTLYFDDATITNQCESASFLYYFPPLICVILFNQLGKVLPSWPEVALIAFCVILLWFMFLGIPVSIAKASFLGYLTVHRADLALGLASMLLSGLYLGGKAARFSDNEEKNKRINDLIYLNISVVWSIIVVFSLLQTPKEAIGNVKGYVWFLIFFATFLLTFLLLSRRSRSYIVLSLFAAIVVSAPFNPLIIAPNKIELKSGAFLEDSLTNSRILSVGSYIHSMNLLASGVHVINGVFYYPQPTLWKALDPDEQYVSLTNRYQHLAFVAESIISEKKYTIENPQSDVVRVTFDPKTFDFRSTGATIILSPIGYHNQLSKNEQLKLLCSGADLYWYWVR